MATSRPQQNSPIHTILCADWGKGINKRAVFVANVPERRVSRLQTPKGWSVAAILAEAKRLSSSGPVLATFDAPLGVPESYLSASPAPKTFLDFLQHAHLTPNFFAPTKSAADWNINRPFFCVPSGQGGLTSYQNAAAAQGVHLLRIIDKKTKAKSAFITSGIPGSVGCATCSLWQELAPLLTSDRHFKLWPFEGDLRSLLDSCPIVIGEIYPRAAYATALLNGPCESRPPLFLAKTNADARRSAINALVHSEWVHAHDVTLDQLDYALNNEDDFDACLTAAALLRCELEQLPFCPPALPAHRIEGGILGTGSINLDLKERPWRS